MTLLLYVAPFMVPSLAWFQALNGKVERGFEGCYLSSWTPSIEGGLCLFAYLYWMKLAGELCNTVPASNQ